MSTNKPVVPKPEKLADLWNTLDNKKSSLKNRCREYAAWTLPYMFPYDNSEAGELPQSVNSIGARCVNHLSNKIVMTLYRPDGPFFRLDLNAEELAEIKEDAETTKDEDAIFFLQNLDNALVEAEKEAMRELNYNKYRSEATNAAKNLIITGNALMYHPENGDPVQSYSLKDYCVKRDLAGNVVLLLTRDTKALSTFSDAVIEKLRASKDKQKYKDDMVDVVIYTELKLHSDGKFHLRQMADDVELDSEGQWPKAELPWIVLTWNLIRGEDYGRGLVEDYAGSFHAIALLSQSFVDAVAIAADIKWLVNPASVVDVKDLNDSESGSYHEGKDGDVVAIQLNKQMDLQLVIEAIDRFEKQVGQAFLLNSAVTRDAERVTAEEIRANIQELDTSNSGVYSRLSDDWQSPTARLLLSRADIHIGKGKSLSIKVITGLESLSRAGDLDNIRAWANDLALLEAVPEDVRVVINPSKFAKFVGIRRGVDTTPFMKSANEMQQEQQSAMDAQNQAINQEAGAKLAVQAGTEAMKQGE